MNSPLILRLVGLRYQLLWAQTRTRNGRIALFFAGYSIAILVIILLTAGGYGAALVAVHSGHAEAVAQAVLGGLFLNGLIISVVTGFGINSAFSDVALRRFALNAPERLAARHLTGILEPVWLFLLALCLGLSTGMYVFGAGGFWLGAVAVVLMVMTDYVLARVMATLIEWLSHVRGGTAILFLMLMSICLTPGLVIPRLAHAHGAKQAVMAWLSYSPPFAAAALTVRAGSAGLLQQFGILAGWIVVLVALLIWLERQAVRPRSAAAAAVTWNDNYERFASIFGPSMAPLAGRTLRYYVRSNKVRFNYIAALPLLAFLTFGPSQGLAHPHYFLRALGTFTIAGFLGTAVMATNQFGFDSSGFRRYFLLPVPPAEILRASSYTALFLGSFLVAAAMVLWMLFAPVPFDPRIECMLLAAGVGGLCLFNGLAIWTSLLSPRRTNFETTFGNQLSLAANVLLIGGVLAAIFGSMALSKSVSQDAVLNDWWIAILFAVLAVLFYLYSLRRGAEVFVSRREVLLNTLEGRN